MASFELVEPTALPISPRSRQLSERQLAVKRRLLEAGLDLVREIGFADLTLRAVATRAGATHTTAYHYFASKSHLVAELFYSVLVGVPVEPPDPSVPLPRRIARALGLTAAKFGEVEALAQAGNVALAQEEPDVVLLRGAIGADLLRRIVISSGDDADAELTELVMLSYMGAMRWAGTGALEYTDVGLRIERVARYFEAAKAAGLTGVPSREDVPHPPASPETGP
jgi:TetR/AcrR family transcriptional regulator, cholesterol catabolism regulator